MDPRRKSPAVARNRDAILAVLRRILPATGAVLEVGCGTGEHGVYFAEHLTGLDWHPTDRDSDALASTTAWVKHCGLPNLHPPVFLDAAQGWPSEIFNAVFTANTIHYSPWETTPGLFQGAAKVLPSGGTLILYGPFRFGGTLTPQSNVNFEAWLKSRDPRFGVRDVDDLAGLGSAVGLHHEETISMPANNHVLVFRRA